MTPEAGPDAAELDLRFDSTDESPSAAPTCSACSGTIAAEYYEAGGAIVCGDCRRAIEARHDSGSGSARLTRAALYGLGGAAAGAALYYAILAITGYEIGLVAIAVGWLVGRAVQRGSDERGGRTYQVLAVMLTYLAIVSTYVPFIVEGLGEASVTIAAPPVAGAGDAGESAAPVATAGSTAEGATSAGEIALGLGVLLLIAIAAPFLAGLENIIGIAIIGFALYQAWKMNARASIAFTGPYAVGAPRPAVDA